MPGFHLNIRTCMFVCINGSCLGFVLWQTIKCINAYIEKPIGTRLKMEKSTALPFPSITVCGAEFMFRYDEYFNKFLRATYYDIVYLKDTCNIR